MNVKLKVMYLGSRLGINEDGSNYYQGQFLEKSSNHTFRLYFPDNTILEKMQPYKDYELDCILYINQKGLWAIKVV